MRGVSLEGVEGSGLPLLRFPGNVLRPFFWLGGAREGVVCLGASHMDSPVSGL